MLSIHEESQDRSATAEELDRPSPRCCTASQQISRESSLSREKLLQPQQHSHQGRIHQHCWRTGPVLLLTRSSLGLRREGLALLTHKPGPFSFLYMFATSDWQIWGYSAFQNENPGAQTLQSAVLSLTSQVRNTAHNIQTASTRRDPAKEEEIQWPTASCLLHFLLCTHLLQLFEATGSQERVLAWKFLGRII